MTQYPKINTIWKRNPKTHKIIEGEWAMAEFGYLQYNAWELTEKIDGTNIRVMWDGSQISFGGKTDNAEIPTFLDEKLHSIFSPLNATFHEVFANSNEVCLYGEGYGDRIQKYGHQYIANGVDFILFDVKIGKWWLGRDSIESIADKLGIKCVPLLDVASLSYAIALAEKGFQSRIGSREAEGIVAKSLPGLLTRGGERIIAKIKHSDFGGEK